MTSIAFTFSTNDFEFVALSGSKVKPILLLKGKISLPKTFSIPSTAAWFETELDLLLNSTSPDIVSYKFSIMRINSKFVTNVYYGQAILNLLCHKKNISIAPTSPTSITPSKFNQTKQTNLITFIENLLGKQPSPWDKGIKETSLIALINL